MTGLSFSNAYPVLKALDVLGDTPSLQLLQSYWLGARRFSEFHTQTGMLKTVVSDRLDKLIKEDCLVKTPLKGVANRYLYQGGDRLLSLYKAALAMLHWERNWGSKNDKVHVELVHRACGKVTEPYPACSSCKQPYRATEIEWSAGPGTGEVPVDYKRRRRQSVYSSEQGPAIFEDITRIIGDRASCLILLTIFMGAKRFGEIQLESKLSTNILSDRLKDLASHHILRFNLDPGQTKRGEYKLTDKGIDTYPTLMTILAWGDEWYGAADGASASLIHRTCGKELVPEMACSACGELINVGDIDFTVEFKDRDDANLSVRI